MIGRKEEVEALREAAMADRSRFVVVYGRRRVGKTFLIREAFDYRFTFSHTGMETTCQCAVSSLSPSANCNLSPRLGELFHDEVPTLLSASRLATSQLLDIHSTCTADLSPRTETLS